MVYSLEPQMLQEQCGKKQRIQHTGTNTVVMLLVKTASSGRIRVETTSPLSMAVEVRAAMESAARAHLEKRGVSEK